MAPLEQLLAEVRGCRYCERHLPLGPNPIIRATNRAKILLIGQAPGTKVHTTGIPWNDPSGDRLRAWLGVDRKTFYDSEKFAIMPMGFCFPGTGKSGDLPPRPECAPLWHNKVRSLLPNLRLVLLIGSYAVRYYLPARAMLTVRDLVLAANFERDPYLPLVHPSPRNKLWLKQNPWFESSVVKKLRRRLAACLAL